MPCMRVSPQKLQNSEHYHPGACKRGKRAPGAPPFRSIATHLFVNFAAQPQNERAVAGRCKEMSYEKRGMAGFSNLVGGLTQFTSQSLRQACVVKPTCNGFLCGTLTPADEVVIEGTFCFRT